MKNPANTLNKNLNAEGTNLNLISKRILEKLEFFPVNDAYYNRLRRIFEGISKIAKRDEADDFFYFIQSKTYLTSASSGNNGDLK